MPEDSTRAAANAMYAAYRTGDVQAFIDLLDEDIDWIIFAPSQIFPFAGARRGKAAIIETLSAIGKDYALHRHELQLMIVEGERAAVLIDAAFTQRSTQRLLRMRIVNFLRFRDGKLVEFREFTDTFDAVEQALGHWLDVGSPRTL